MDSINASTVATSPGVGAVSSSMEALTSDNFLELLVTQLTNQDPLEPMGNEELLRQISSIREIELSTNLSDALTRLTGQQHFSSASGLIGRHVTTNPDASGASLSGVVVGVRFNDGGKATLVLSDGRETPLANVATIQSPLEAGEALVGLTVVGLDRRDASEPRAVEGLVTSARVDETGEVVLELDTGEALRMRDVIGVTQDASA